MATRMNDVLTQRGNHEIGNLNTKWTKHMANGAIADENIENYTLVETLWTDGELHCKQLTDATKKGYLITTVEEEQLMEGEEYVDFYNAAGEIIRLTDVDAQKNSRFETSAFVLNDDAVANGGSAISAVQVGQVAHFDPASKKYMISDPSSPATAYDTAVNKFEVVGADTDFGYAFDKTTIRLMSI